jgi:hypothetical protein
LHTDPLRFDRGVHMTKAMRFAGALLCVVLGGCGGEKKKENLQPASNVLYAAARQITPVVIPAGVSGSFEAVPGGPDLATNPVMPWYSGNLGGLIFSILRDYQYPRDEGKVDASNLYKVLHSIGNEFERYYPGLAAITEKAVASPFDFGPFTVVDTYNKAKNNIEAAGVHMAARQVGNDKHMLAAGSVGDASWVTQGVYLGDSKDLELNTIVLNRYTTGSMAGDLYGVRSWIKGNETTHAFSFRFIQFSSSGSGTTLGAMSYFYSVIGTGVSQGAGAHVLYYGSSTREPNQFGDPAPGYYCFEAADAEAQYQAKFAAFPDSTGGGEPIDATSHCWDLKTGPGGLDAQLADQPLWGRADVTFDPASFTGGGASHLELTF